MTTPVKKSIRSYNDIPQTLFGLYFKAFLYTCAFRYHLNCCSSVEVGASSCNNPYVTSYILDSQLVPFCYYKQQMGCGFVTTYNESYMQKLPNIQPLNPIKERGICYSAHSPLGLPCLLHYYLLLVVHKMSQRIQQARQNS